MRCISCHHFKVRVITEKNIKELEFKYLGRIKQYIKHYGYARICYCLYNKLWKEVYINSYAFEMDNTEQNYNKELRLSKIIRGLKGKGCKVTGSVNK